MLIFALIVLDDIKLTEPKELIYKSSRDAPAIVVELMFISSPT